MITLLIADDHPIFLKGLQDILQSVQDMQVIAQAHNGQEALQIFTQSQPDVVILDLDMPQLSGLEAARHMLEQNPDLPVILLTMHKEQAHFIRALEVGILGYVLKENAAIDVIQAVRKVSTGTAYISPEMSAFLLRKPIRPVQRKPVDSLTLLTPAELQILQLVGQYKSSKEIADQLFISERTVNNHRMNMTRKLELTGKNSLLRFAIENVGVIIQF
jgi:DNA-binding NarL/FixJ family response regulator